MDLVYGKSLPEVGRLEKTHMGLSGVEPLTSRLSGVRSNHLSYRPAPPPPPAPLHDATSPRCPLARHCATWRRSVVSRSSLPIPPRPFPRPELLILLVVELVVQVVVLVEIVQVLLVKLVLVQLVVEVLVEVLVLFEVSELLVAETVAATLERPVRRLTGQHCHPQLGLWLWCERAIRLSPPPRYDSSADRAFRASLRRSVAPNARLRSRMDDGVTSISSSSSMYSSASSSVTCRGGSRMIISSDAVVLMLVSFFSLEGFTSMSPTRAFSPTTMPSYTGSPGLTNIVPRSCKLKSAYPTTTPSRSATNTPRLRPCSGPAHGP